MTRPIVILRPQPGTTTTAQRVRAAQLDPIAIPLFVVVPLDWTPPDPSAFDALLFSSANAPRHAGPGLAALAHLPVVAVGPGTAHTAQSAGLTVIETGNQDLAALVARQPAHQRLLWLAGRDRIALTHPAIRKIIPVYASEPVRLTLADADRMAGGVVLIHSSRAARQLRAELDRLGLPRTSIRVAAISARAANAAGTGWERIAVAAAPNDAALIAVARSLAIDP
ncbi:uroporphyrinogen-III synthase [Sphingomonas sp. ST-64]|uniref:Uroporphyrinogen-III synthase n=1 Tax=Sphingomonas plantiphila TaxID=3163295 RepID=A0ABW8YJL5_9SPHN